MLEEGKTISKADQQFVNECLDRIAELMEELGIEDEEENDDDLYRTFEKINIEQFR
ncbi:GTPase activator [Rodentibacter pneumotropicus]|uniref:GTPase activator n=2 Tax=Rodentibacter pneumotropicus TaxID=758 RepID=A0A448MTS3_9PAST|nr:GTPase activator [Rodentibacter pneumotropicus]